MCATYRADSGFRHVKPEDYTPRLLHVSGKGKRITIRECALKKASLDSGDVFILDLGRTIFQVNTIALFRCIYCISLSTVEWEDMQ